MELFNLTEISLRNILTTRVEIPEGGCFSKNYWQDHMMFKTFLGVHFLCFFAFFSKLLENTGRSCFKTLLSSPPTPYTLFKMKFKIKKFKVNNSRSSFFFLQVDFQILLKNLKMSSKMTKGGASPGHLSYSATSRYISHFQTSLEFS